MKTDSCVGPLPKPPTTYIWPFATTAGISETDTGIFANSRHGEDVAVTVGVGSRVAVAVGSGVSVGGGGGVVETAVAAGATKSGTGVSFSVIIELGVVDSVNWVVSFSRTANQDQGAA